MSSSQSERRLGRESSMKRKREESASPMSQHSQHEGEDRVVRRGFESDDPKPRLAGPESHPRKKHRVESSGGKVDDTGSDESDGYSRCSDSHSEVPPGDDEEEEEEEEEEEVQGPPLTREEEYIASMSRYWDTMPDTLLDESIHPHVIRGPMRERLEFKSWPKAVLSNLVHFAQLNIGVEEAVKYIEKAYRERGDVSGPRSSTPWLIATDIADAARMARHDGYEAEKKKEITSRVPDRNFDLFR